MFDKYLRDVLAISAPRFPGLDLDEQLSVYRTVLHLTSKDALQSCSGIHAGIWVNEQLLFDLCRLASLPDLDAAFRAGPLLTCMQQMQFGSRSELALQVVELLVAHLDPKLACKGSFPLWQRRVTSCHESLRRMLLLGNAEDGVDASRVKTVIRQWYGINLFRIIVVDVFLCKRAGLT